MDQQTGTKLKGIFNEESNYKKGARGRKKQNTNKSQGPEETKAAFGKFSKNETIPSSSFGDANQGSMPIVEGFRISCSGRLQMSPRSKPAEKAETVVLSRGVLPFNSFNQNIDFKQTYATNAYGTVGIKV